MRHGAAGERAGGFLLCFVGGLFLVLYSATAGADESRELADRGAAPRGASGVILVPAKKQPTKASSVTVPRLLHYAEATYPRKALEDGVEGEVILELTTDERGQVTSAKLRRGGGHGFDEAALAAAPRLRFEPARTNPEGKAVKAKFLFRYRFILTESDDVAKEPAEVGATEGPVKAGAEPPTGVSVPLEMPEGVIDVFVRGDPLDRPAREVTRRMIGRRELNRIPGTKGDALRSLENLPGVGRPPPFSGLLIVRGSAPEDSLTFIDGAPVLLPYHFGGLASVVPTERLDRLDFFPGNFGSKYGRAMGGVVDVVLRSPRTDGYHGLAQVDFIDGRIQLEGPVPLLKGWGFSMAGRRSWLDAVLTPVIEAAGAQVVVAPAYYDYQFILENKPDPDTRFRASFYGSDDAFEVVGGEVGEEATGKFGLHIAFQRAQLGYEKRLAGGDRLSWMLAFGRDVIDFELGFSAQSILFRTEVYSLHNRFAYSHRVAKWLAIEVGADLSSSLASVTSRLPVDESEKDTDGRPGDAAVERLELEDDKVNGTFARPAAYVQAELTPAKHLRLVPGLRVDHSGHGDRVDVSPRVNMSWGMFDDYPQTTIKAAAGVYHQPPSFFDLLLGASDRSDRRSSRALHFSLGLQQDLTRQLEVSVEGFVKQLDRLPVGSNKARDVVSGQDAESNEGAGYVVGGEMMLKYKPDKRFFGWLAYTLSRSARRDAPDLDEYLVSFDQTHVMTVLGSYHLGRGWELGARFRVVSGNLVTPVICNPEAEGCDNFSANAIYHAPTGSYIPFPAAADNSERLPLFHQLDIRVDKTWTFASWKLGLYLDVTNFYNHQAAEGVDYQYDFAKREYVTGLPIIPSLGLRGQF